MAIQLKKYFHSHPFLFTAFILITSRVLGMVVFNLIKSLNPSLDINSLGWVIQLIYATTGVLLVIWVGLRQESGLSTILDKNGYYTWITWLLLPIFIILSEGVSPGLEFKQIVILFISALFVAINEEVIFRGVFLVGFLRKNLLATVLIPSLIFGLIHLPNIFMGSSLVFTIFQVVWAVLGGIALTCLRIRCGSLYPVILVHFLVDFSEYLSTGEVGIHAGQFTNTTLVGFLCLSILFALYELWMLQRKDVCYEK